MLLEEMIERHYVIISGKSGGMQQCFKSTPVSVSVTVELVLHASFVQIGIEGLFALLKPAHP